MFDLNKEFNRQVEVLLTKGYPKLSNLSKEEFLKKVNTLKEKLQDRDLKEPDYESGYLPFVIVIKSDLVDTKSAVEKIEREGKGGVVKLFPHEPEDFQNIPNLNIPEENIYLLIDVNRGKETINKAPAQAMVEITGQGRLPLNIDEGVAIVTHHPDFLMKNNCFSLLGSRNPSDKRVPAIWINSAKNVNLGWCWHGNPHTWLGSASCKHRIG